MNTNPLTSFLKMNQASGLLKPAIGSSSGGQTLAGAITNTGAASVNERQSFQPDNIFSFIQAGRDNKLNPGAMSFATPGTEESDRARKLYSGTVDVTGKRVSGGDTSLNAALKAKLTGLNGIDQKALGSQVDSIFDKNGYFPGGPKGLFDTFGTKNSNGSFSGAYGAYGGFISDAVKPKIHERPENAVVDKKMWDKISTNLGFLFKDGEQLNKALDYTMSKIDDQHADLKKDSWSLSFITANQLTKEAINGKIGDSLLSDQKFLDPYRGKTSNSQEKGLMSEMHNINIDRLKQINQEEGKDLNETLGLLEQAGFNTKEKNWAFDVSARGLQGTAESMKILNNLTGKIDEALAKSSNPDAKVKLNLHFGLATTAEGDSGAFPSIVRGMEHGQQVMLSEKGGLSTDPERASQLSFFSQSEKGMEGVIEQLDQQLSANKGKVEIGSLEFNYHMHGGEQGSAMIKAGVVTDATSFDGSDSDMIRKMVSTAVRHGARDLTFNGDSCHSGNLQEKFKDAIRLGIQDGLKASGKEGDLVQVQLRNNGHNAGWTAAHNYVDGKEGYRTYAYNSDGTKKMVDVHSNHDGIEGSYTKAETSYLGSNSNSFKDGLGEAAKQSYLNQVDKDGVQQQQEQMQGQSTSSQSEIAAQKPNTESPKFVDKKPSPENELVAKDWKNTPSKVLEPEKEKDKVPS